jgi:hypothetical protein
MAVFHVFTGRDIDRWGKAAARPPFAAKIAGAVSLTLWVAVISFGRWIGFTLH